MKKGSTFILRAGLVVFGGIILALCIFALPAGIKTDVTGLYRPVLIGLYFPAVPFFFALFYSWILLNHIDRNTAFSEAAVHALKKIKYCAMIIAGLFIAGMPIIFNAGDKDDAPGVIAIALIIIFTSAVIATFAGVLQKLLHNVVEIKAENDSTV